MYFVIAFFSFQSLVAFALMAVFPDLPHHFLQSILVAVAGYAIAVTVAFAVYVVVDWKEADDDLERVDFIQASKRVHPLNETPPVSPYFAQSHSIRHLGLSNAILLSVSEGADWIPPDQRRT